MVLAYGCSDCLSAPKPRGDANPAARTPPKTCRKNCRRRTGTAGPPPAATAAELRPRREDPISPPTQGAEGRGWMLDVGGWRWDVGRCMLDVRCWTLDVECWMLNVGC